MENLENYKARIEECVDDGLQAFLDGRLAVNALREAHNTIGELNHQAVKKKDFNGDTSALRFMHQVTKITLHELDKNCKGVPYAVESKLRRRRLQRDQP